MEPCEIAVAMNDGNQSLPTLCHGWIDTKVRFLVLMLGLGLELSDRSRPTD